MQDGKRGSQEFADIVPGLTTEVYLDLTDRRNDAERADQRQPALVMLQGDLPGQVFRLQTGRNVIGRKADCQIRLRGKAVSDHHAEIVASPAGVSVTDLSSTNGTVVNGRRIRGAVLLAKGNLLKLGHSVFKYVDSLAEVEVTETLHTRSTIDALTGLWNRQHFLSRAAYLIDQASAAKPVSILAFDLDRFADVVEARGRSGADTVLQAIARMLRETVDDIGRHFARVGEEAFAIVAADLPLAGASATAEKIRTALEAIGVTASIGVAATQRPGETAETLLIRAEDLVARARREGGDRVAIA